MSAPLDWDLVVNRLGPKLYRYFAGRFDGACADDLTQETLIRLVSKFNQGEYNDQKGSIDMWAFGIARFVRLEEIRRRAKSAQEDSSSEELGDLSFMNHQEKKSELTQLRKSISDLPEPQQEIILLMVNKEMNMQSIATHMDMPIGTVKSHIHRAKKNIFSFFSETSGGSNG